MKKLFFLSIAIVLIHGANATGTIQTGKDIYNICDFGAIGDGNTLNTKAVQKAIDVCSEAGGGIVYFPPGTYKSGTLYLKSYVTLELETGAVLLGSKDMKDYIKAEKGSYIYGPGSQYAFLHGKNVDHVSIIGQGIIDGNTALDHGSRGPLAVIFTNSENILMEGITVANSPGWSVTIFSCRYVDVIRVKVLNGFADGINPVCSRDVLLDGVLIDHSGDDPITIKNEGPAKEFLSENIKIINTTVSNTTHLAVKIGTGTAGLFIDGYEPFSRWIDLKPGESQVVFFETTPAEIQKALWYVVLPGFISGTHEITIGSDPLQKITIVESKNQYRVHSEKSERQILVNIITAK